MTALLRRDVVLLAPDNDFAAADGLSPEGIEVRDPETYTILTETDTVLTGETLAAVTAEAGRYLFPHRTPDQAVRLDLKPARYPSGKPGYCEIDGTVELFNLDI